MATKIQRWLRKHEPPSRQFPIFSDEYGNRYLESYDDLQELIKG